MLASSWCYDLALWFFVSDSRVNALGNGVVIGDVGEGELHGLFGTYSCWVHLVVS